MSDRLKENTRVWIAAANLAGALFAALVLKTRLLIAGSVPFNGDEAVVGLMARHILQGSRPVFFYGQAYMGSLDAWLVAGAFLLFGEGVAAIRIVQIGLYLAYLGSVWLLAGAFFSDRATRVFAVWLAAIPSVLVTTYTTASLGGYGEIILLGNLVLWLGFQVTRGCWRYKRVAWLAFGFTGGVAFWVHGLAVIYLVPVAVLVLWKPDRNRLVHLAFATVAFLAGASPWLLYNFFHSGMAVKALAQSQYPGSPLERFAGLLLLGVPTLLNLRFPWSPQFAPWPVLLVGLLAFLVMLLFWWRSWRLHREILTPGAGILLGFLGLTMLGAFLGTGFGVDATGRYLLPLAVLLVLGMAACCAHLWRRRPLFGLILVGAVLLINGLETSRAASSIAQITTQFDPVSRFGNHYDAELVEFLHQHGEHYGYSNYWVSFRLAFLSQEEIIFQARLPYKSDLSYSPNDDRYPEYGSRVAASPNRAYITTLNPALDSRLRREFARLGVTYLETQIGEYHVYYRFSEAVPVEALDLAVTREGTLNVAH